MNWHHGAGSWAKARLAYASAPGTSSSTRPAAPSVWRVTPPRYAEPSARASIARSAASVVFVHEAVAGPPVSRHRPVFHGQLWSVTDRTTSTSVVSRRAERAAATS